MLTNRRQTHPFCLLTVLTLHLLVLPQWAESQPTLSIDVDVLGGAIEPTGNPDMPLTVFFVGQPAVIELTVTNMGEEAQTIVTGGGGGGGFVFDSAVVDSEGDGSCMIYEGQTFFDCSDVTIPGTGFGKTSDIHNSRQVIIQVRIIEVSTGGFSYFVDNMETSEVHTTGGPADFRMVSETRTLNVQSIPPLVDISVTPGEVGKTDFSREYATGTKVRLTAPDEIVTAVFPLFHFSWSVDSGEEQEKLGIDVTMDMDHTARAQYGGLFTFGAADLPGSQSSGKAIDPVDIYADGILVVDDLGPDQVTPHVTVPLQTTIDVTDAGAQDNNNPIVSFDHESDGSPTIVMITDDGYFVNQDARTEANDPGQTDVTLFLPLSQETADAIRVVHRGSSAETELFGPDTPANENGFTPYASLEPGPGVVEVLDRASGEQLDAFQGVLAEGGAILGVLKENASGKRQGFTLLLFDAEGGSVETSIVTASENESPIPSTFALHANYPNPFNPETVIRFDVSEQTHVRLLVLNALGQVVATLIDGVRSSGTHAVVFDARDLPSGAYFYRMKAGRFAETRRMTLLR